MGSLGTDENAPTEAAELTAISGALEGRVALLDAISENDASDACDAYIVPVLPYAMLAPDPAFVSATALDTYASDDAPELVVSLVVPHAARVSVMAPSPTAMMIDRIVIERKWKR